MTLCAKVHKRRLLRNMNLDIVVTRHPSSHRVETTSSFLKDKTHKYKVTDKKINCTSLLLIHSIQNNLIIYLKEQFRGR